MELQHKPRLGILALMLEGYEPLFPGIMASQHKYVEDVIASLSGTADFVFPRIAASREAIEALTAQYNAEGLDGILILMLSYSQGQYLVHAMQRNTLPLALALVQPDETVGDDFEEWELTVNQGIHGSQDNANCLMRAGIPCAFFAGSRKNGELAAFAADFGAAAHTACALRRMKIGIIGKLAGMGDVITDDMAVYRKLGPEFVYDSIGAVQRACAGVTPEDISARAALTGESPEALRAVADEKVDFYPEAFARRQEELMGDIGHSLAPAFADTEDGAPTHSYRAAQHSFAAPLGGLGAFRIGEDGRLYFAGKSEHYQIPLGHDFPGYSLIENAKRLGIPNATHNNTRGFITRTLERRLIAAANGLQPTDPALDRILSQKEPGVLNTVINLETGSLAVEAALKMMLSRFYTIDGAPAQYAGRVPVFVVMADNAGGVTGNYHGTTVLAQTLRGLWPDFYTAAQKNELYKVVSVPINDSGAFAETMRRWNEGKYKTAGFCHEIVLMNYGGIRLSEEYLQAAYKVCRATDTPVLCDEIQSCAWYDGLFLFRKYGLTPDFVSVGKGFPGGVYPASKILTSAAFDSLSQFGALVTNGQEELASLAYLVTMEFIGANGAHIEAAGRYYHEQVRALAQKYPQVCTGVEGDAHMTALCFDSVDDAVDFCTRMNRDRCVDISAQTYKPNCPPVALTKLPLITTETMAGRLVALFDSALAETAAQKGAAL